MIPEIKVKPFSFVARRISQPKIRIVVVTIEKTRTGFKDSRCLIVNADSNTPQPTLTLQTAIPYIK